MNLAIIIDVPDEDADPDHELGITNDFYTQLTRALIGHDIIDLGPTTVTNVDALT